MCESIGHRPLWGRCPKSFVRPSACLSACLSIRPYISIFYRQTFCQQTMKQPGLFSISDSTLREKCILDIGESVRSTNLRTAVALEYAMGSRKQAFSILHIDYGDTPREIMILIYTQNSCKSPFREDFVGTVTRGIYWFSVISKGKNVLVDKRYEPEKYPVGFPKWFQGLNAEDYHENFCHYVCSNHPNISWESFMNEERSSCEIRLHTTIQRDAKEDSSLCSPQQCVEKRTRASLILHLDILRYEDMGSATSPTTARENRTEIWLKGSPNLYTKTVRYRKSTSEFLSELGGILGLWVGASVLTLIEIGELLLNLLKNATATNLINPRILDGP